MSKQQRLLDQFEELSNENRLPHSIILIGPEYSDQEEILEKIAELENLEIVEYDPDFNYYDTVLKLLVNIKTEDLTESNQIKLLKEFEEPNENIYYVINSPLEEFIFEPLKNRGKVFYLEKYSTKELEEVMTKKDYKKQLLFCCQTPKMILEAEQYIERLDKISKQFIENYKKLAIQDYLKILDLLNFDDDSTKINPIIFIEILIEKFFTTVDVGILCILIKYRNNYSIIRDKKRYVEAMLLELRGF